MLLALTKPVTVEPEPATLQPTPAVDVLVPVPVTAVKLPKVELLNAVFKLLYLAVIVAAAAGVTLTALDAAPVPTELVAVTVQL